MSIENEDLKNEVVKNESELKNLIVNFVGEKINPVTDHVTVENIVEIFAVEFPEFLLAVAEENWVNGYTQALNDVDYFSKQAKINTKEDINEHDKLHKKENS